MIFKNKEYFWQKCLVTFLSLLMVSNINLTCIPKISASDTLPDKSISIKSEKKDSWWKRIVSRPKNIITGTFILGFSTFATLIFGKSKRQAEQERIERERKNKEAEAAREANKAVVVWQKKAEVTRRNEEEANKAVVVWQPGAKEVEKAAREEVEIMPASGNEQPEKKSLAVHPLATGAFCAFSWVTNGVHNAVVRPVNALIAATKGGSTASTDKKFDAGILGKKWMSRIENDVHFHEMLIPGSHDSGTYSMRSSLALTQTLNIYEQLSYGVRCLDFRIRSYWGSPCIYHGLSAGEYVLNILKDIDEFITENPLEVVFIKMEIGSSSKCSKNGLNLTLNLPEMQVLKDRCLTKSDLSRLGKGTLSDLTMGDIRKLRRNIIIISDYESEFFHKSKNLISKFDSESRSAGTDVMVGETLKMLNEAERIGKLNSISPIHTANLKRIVCLEGAPLAQEEYYSGNRNRMLMESEDFKEKANMVSLDDIERNAEFIYGLISINRTRGLMIK